MLSVIIYRNTTVDRLTIWHVHFAQVLNLPRWHVRCTDLPPHFHRENVFSTTVYEHSTREPSRHHSRDVRRRFLPDVDNGIWNTFADILLPAGKTDRIFLDFLLSGISIFALHTFNRKCIGNKFNPMHRVFRPGLHVNTSGNSIASNLHTIRATGNYAILR